MTKKNSKNNLERELTKKSSRRIQESINLTNIELDSNYLNNPVNPKKPMEFKFDKEDVKSFEYPINIGNTIVEKKSDGNCIHLIVDRKSSINPIRIYSSELNEWNVKCFPELSKELKNLPSGYYHGEMLGLKPEHVQNFRSLDEFVAVSNRPKLSTKNVNSELLEKYPLKIDIFDVLKYDKDLLLSKPLGFRREILENKLEYGKHLNIIPQWTVNLVWFGINDIQSFFRR